MPDTLEDVKGYREVPERRSHQRHQIRSLAYIELDEGNGGILLNVSESGLAVQAVTPLIDEILPNMRLQLSQTAAPIAAVGQIVWSANSKKVVGIRFIDFPAESASMVKEWIASENFPLESPRELNFPRETPVAFAETTTDPLDASLHNSSNSEDQTIARPTASSVASEPVFIDLDAHSLDTANHIESPTSIQSVSIAGNSRENSVLKTGVKSEVAPEVLSATHAGSEHSSWLLYVLIGILAVCSTAAGWSVGRTGFYGALGRFHALHSEIGTPDTVSSPAIEDVKLPGIEIVDLNNRRWFVPFAGSVADASLTPHPQPAASLPSAHQKTQTPNRTFTLASPGRPTAAKPRVADADAPPAISSQPSGMAGSGSPLSAISGNANVLPPPSPQLNSPSAVVESAQLIHRVEPIYPYNAAEQFAGDATIKMHITIGADGQVQNVKPVSGSALFFEAATNAIRQWRYRPALINGKPSVSDGEISMVFRHP